MADGPALQGRQLETGPGNVDCRVFFMPGLTAGSSVGVYPAPEHFPAN
jgi:hypothetical protein